MATAAQIQPQSQLVAEVNPPHPQKSQEPVPEQPLTGNDPKMDELLKKYGKRLIDLCAEKRNGWMQKRLGIIQKVLKNKEMHKGNQYLGVYPGSFQAFDAMEEYDNWAGPSDQKNGDRSMDQRPRNFYQMVEKAYVAALGAGLPKTRIFPANAQIPDDRETAKVGSRIEEIVQRANKAKSMLLQRLMELFTGGMYVRLTRYVVDSGRTGTHKQTVFKLSKVQIIPDSFLCPNCGTPTATDGNQPPGAAFSGTSLGAQAQPSCPNCGAPFTQQDFFPGHTDQIPVAEQKEDVPNGMVMQDVYGALNCDADPDSADLANTPLFNIAVEVNLGWLRTTFPEHWAEFQEGQTGGSATDQLERLYRDMLTMPAGYSTWFSLTTQSKPTYNRTWINPDLYAELGSKAEADEIRQDLPDGCMLAWTGDIPLQIRPDKMTDTLTWCGTEQKGFGLFPPPAGDPAVPVQEDINDCYSKINTYLDTLCCGILLANEEYVDTAAFNGKRLLPGILNPVKTRKGRNADIGTMIFQVKAQIDQAVFQHVTMAKQDLELLVGTPPQMFGAGTQAGVETATGQQQQQQSGLAKLGLQWQFVADEEAEASENAIRCAARNMTEDWLNVVADRTEEFRNEYVHLDQVKGEIHVHSDTDSGFPMTYAEQKSWWADITQNANNVFAQILLSVPENVDAAIRFVCPPGVVAPSQALQDKMLQVIAELMKGAPIQQADPITGQPIMAPSVMPDKYLDGPNLPTYIKEIPYWAADNWDLLKDNENAKQNLIAFYKMCLVYTREIAAEQQLTAGMPQMPPPKGQVSQPQLPAAGGQ